jgi:hypothetical protein
MQKTTKINSKWIKDLNANPETLKLLQETIGKTLQDIGIGNNFLNGTSIAQEVTAKIDKWDCIKLKGYCISKETISRIKQ